MELAPQLWPLVSYSFPIPLMCYEDPRMLSAQVLYLAESHVCSSEMYISAAYSTCVPSETVGN